MAPVHAQCVHNKGKKKKRKGKGEWIRAHQLQLLDDCVQFRRELLAGRIVSHKVGSSQPGWRAGAGRQNEMDPLQPVSFVGAPLEGGSFGGGSSGEGGSGGGRVKPTGRTPKIKPAQAAKSVATASRAFFKGLKRTVSEASDFALIANLPRGMSQTCQTGVAVLAVGHGLVDNKNGRVSREEEQRAANRKPQAFLHHDGQVPIATMHKLFRAAVESNRAGSPPADITIWKSPSEMEKFFVRRETERSVSQPNGNLRPSAAAADAGGILAAQPHHQPILLQAQSDWGVQTHVLEPNSGLLAAPAWPAGSPVHRGCARFPADILWWLREECATGLDEEDIGRLMHCLAHPDWGIKNKEFLFALSEEDLKLMLAPIREQGLKDYVIQKCRKFRTVAEEGPPAKARKTNSGAKA